MDLQGRIIRPPSEANSILLQITLGCSHNKCAFCGAYGDKDFRPKALSIVMDDIAFAARHCRRQRRLFLCDGDAMALSHKKLCVILNVLKSQLPWVTRVGTYASVKSLLSKSDHDLRELRHAGLRMVYMGLESGDDNVLRSMGKFGTAEMIVDQARRVRNAGMKLNMTVLSGLGGTTGSLDHARATAKVLNSIEPEQISVLSLILVPGTPLHARHERGDFCVPNARGLLLEMRELILGLDVKKGLFLADHASNHLPLKARLPSGKQRLLAELERALADSSCLKPESLRRL